MHFILSISVVIMLITLVKFYRKNKGIDSSSLAKKIEKIASIEKESKQRLEKRNKTSEFLESTSSWIKYLKIFEITKQKQEHLDYLALRVNKKINDVTLDGNDLKTLRSLFMLIHMVIMILLSLFNFKVLPLVLSFPVTGFLMDTLIERSIKKKDKKIEENFYDFYSEFYATYKFPKVLKEKLDDVAMRYYNRANEETAYLIDLLRADCKISEDYALDNLKKNYQIVKIHRLVDQVRMIIQGKNVGVDGLENFKKELDDEKDFLDDLANKQKIEKADKIATIPIIILFTLMGIWFYIRFKK